MYFGFGFDKDPNRVVKVGIVLSALAVLLNIYTFYYQDKYGTFLWSAVFC